jgi:DNA-binding NarL/FixJ family response regulator
MYCFGNGGTIALLRAQGTRYKNQVNQAWVTGRAMQQMQTVRQQAFSGVVTPKTCARCGRNFSTLNREYVCSVCRQPRTKHKIGGPSLSFRESQIVALIRQAKANKEIAYELCLSEGTVKEYLSRIFKKLQVRNRTELALRGLDVQVAVAS